MSRARRRSATHPLPTSAWRSGISTRRPASFERAARAGPERSARPPSISRMAGWTETDREMQMKGEVVDGEPSGTYAYWISRTNGMVFEINGTSRSTPPAAVGQAQDRRVPASQTRLHRSHCGVCMARRRALMKRNRECSQSPAQCSPSSCSASAAPAQTKAKPAEKADSGKASPASPKAASTTALLDINNCIEGRLDDAAGNRRGVRTKIIDGRP